MGQGTKEICLFFFKVILYVYSPVIAEINWPVVNMTSVVSMKSELMKSESIVFLYIQFFSLINLRPPEISVG